jgi:hypothetical protein
MSYNYEQLYEEGRQFMSNPRHSAFHSNSYSSNYNSTSYSGGYTGGYSFGYNGGYHNNHHYNNNHHHNGNHNYHHHGSHGGHHDLNSINPIALFRSLDTNGDGRITETGNSTFLVSRIFPKKLTIFKIFERSNICDASSRPGRL